MSAGKVTQVMLEGDMHQTNWLFTACQRKSYINESTATS